MSSGPAVVLWLGVVIAGIAAMQWGAARVCALFGTLRRHWGLPATAGGVLLGLATASPEVSVNVASVAFGWPDLGLGAALGSNVPALPLIFAVSYASTRWHRRGRAEEGGARSPEPRDGGEAPSPVPRVQPDAVDVQALPYLLVLLLLALLSLPPRWAGLQPIDGLLLLLAFALYFVRALRRSREVDPCGVPRRALLSALIGLPVIAGGAVAAVMAARRLDETLGIPDLVGGLFVIGLLCALPEAFAAWRLSHEGRATGAVSSAVADGVVSLTVALVPLAVVGATIGNAALYAVNLAFIALVLLAYIVMSHRRRGTELALGRVLIFGGGYGAYLAVTVAILT